MKRISIVFFALFTIACATQSPQKLSFANNPVIAHRGAWKANNFPENSIAALREAIRLKCTGSEFDVWMTADDSLVVNHDHEYFGLDIEHSSYNQLLDYKLSNGEKIPTAREYLLEGMKNNTTTRLVFEIKPSTISKQRGKAIAEKAFNLVKALKAEPYVVYISFDLGILQRLLELDPTVNTQYLNGELSPTQLKDLGIQGLDYHYKVLQQNEGWIDKAKTQGIDLNAWTVNDEKDLQWMLNNKFDFITTNEPEIAFKLFSEKF